MIHLNSYKYSSIDNTNVAEVEELLKRGGLNIQKALFFRKIPESEWENV